MERLFLMFLPFVFYKAGCSGKDFYSDCLSVENTRGVRGILAVLVVFHHMSRVTGETPLFFLFDNIGVLCVAVFFFLSGFGLQKSLMKKPNYLAAIPRKRIPSVALPYLVLIAIYWGFSFCTGAPYTPVQVLVSLVNGQPVVAYSWYILCILLFYVLYYISACLFSRRPLGILLCNVLFVTAWAFLCRAMKYESYWYNAALTFPMGIFWAIHEEKLFSLLKKRYWLILAVCLPGFLILYAAALGTVQDSRIILPLFWGACCAFVLLAVLILMKFRFRNPVLSFLGGISLELYGIHGLFISLFLGSEKNTVRCAAVLAASIVSAWLLHRVTLLFRKQKKPAAV